MLAFDIGHMQQHLYNTKKPQNRVETSNVKHANFFKEISHAINKPKRINFHNLESNFTRYSVM